MPAKTKAKRAARGVRAPKARKGATYECRVCGYRLVVDRACGCAEEHAFICCDKPMKKAAAKK